MDSSILNNISLYNKPWNSNSSKVKVYSVKLDMSLLSMCKKVTMIGFHSIFHHSGHDSMSADCHGSPVVMATISILPLQKKRFF